MSPRYRRAVPPLLLLASLAVTGGIAWWMVTRGPGDEKEGRSTRPVTHALRGMAAGRRALTPDGARDSLAASPGGPVTDAEMKEIQQQMNRYFNGIAFPIHGGEYDNPKSAADPYLDSVVARLGFSGRMLELFRFTGRGNSSMMTMGRSKLEYAVARALRNPAAAAMRADLMANLPRPVRRGPFEGNHWHSWLAAAAEGATPAEYTRMQGLVEGDTNAAGSLLTGQRRARMREGPGGDPECHAGGIAGGLSTGRGSPRRRRRSRECRPYGGLGARLGRAV